MNNDFTLLLLMQHYPIFQQLQVISSDDVFIDENVAGFLPTTELQIDKRILDPIYAYASVAVRH